jgi:hypothetical protein
VKNRIDTLGFGFWCLVLGVWDFESRVWGLGFGALAFAPVSHPVHLSAMGPHDSSVLASAQALTNQHLGVRV